ncbi:MAG: hypothetical protein JWQ09_4456 [Segetibacter sp.]|nr:hypothetical protein [Segetibacter sp.]
MENKSMKNNKSLGLHANQEPLSIDDVIYDGKDYYRLYVRDNGEVTGISCTKGYILNIQQKDLENFVRIGTFKGNEHLFECD